MQLDDLVQAVVVKQVESDTLVQYASHNNKVDTVPLIIDDANTK